MNFLNEFESRIESVFGSAPQGYTEPFSFKKLAKKAAKEMDAETYEIAGVATAPALYTVLVSPADDALMRPLYAQITDETAQYLAAEAEKRGYTLVGMPLVRFMVDPSLRSGRFAVFAENVDFRALERLRAEEIAFMGGNSSLGGAARAEAPSSQAPAPSSAEPGIIPLPEIDSHDAFGAAEPQSVDAGLDIIPTDYAGAFDEDVPADVVPKTQRKATPLVDNRRSNASPEHIANEHPVSCILVDRQTGRTYSASASSAVIGRERASANVVLSDPNVSRQHAQLSFDGSVWHIIDLKSTNGTLVNDIDIDECALSDGDIITVGLVTLEFRES